MLPEPCDARNPGIGNAPGLESGAGGSFPLFVLFFMRLLCNKERQAVRYSEYLYLVVLLYDLCFSDFLDFLVINPNEEISYEARTLGKCMLYE